MAGAAPRTALGVPRIGRRRYGTYERLSEDRVGAGVGIGRQHVENRAYGEALGWEFVDSYQDNDTSATQNVPRPEFDRLLGDLASGRIDALVCWHLDRLTRRPAELETIMVLAREYGFKVGAVHGDVDLTTAAGRWFARQLGSMAAYEQEHKAERQILANRDRAAAGEVWVTGVRCFGYDDTGMILVKSEAAVLKDVAKRVLAGESLRSLVHDLRDKGVKTTAGGTWTSQSLRRLLCNPRLAGIRVYKNEVVGQGKWPAIFDEVEHKKLVAALVDPDRQPEKAMNTRKYLLSGGLLTCGAVVGTAPDGSPLLCGKNLQSQPSNQGKRGYVCRSGSPLFGCGKIRISAEALEEEVATRVMARLSEPDVRAQLERASAAMSTDDETIMAALAAIDERLQEAGREYVRKDVSMSTLKGIEQEARLQKQRLRDQLARAKRLVTIPASTYEGMATWWVDAPLKARRDMIQLVLRRIIVHPASRPGRMRLDLARLEWDWIVA